MAHIMLIVFAAICSVLGVAKQNFQVTIERVEVTDTDAELVNASIRVTKYNRTVKAVNCNFTLLKDLGYDVEVKVDAFALYSNEYRRTPIAYTRKLCDFYKIEYLWAKNQIDKYSHFPSKCPIRAVSRSHALLDTLQCIIHSIEIRDGRGSITGDYYLKDLVVDGANIPAAANFPWTSVMIHFRMFYKDVIYYGVKAYVTLDHDVELKRLG